MTIELKVYGERLVKTDMGEETAPVVLTIAFENESTNADIRIGHRLLAIVSHRRLAEFCRGYLHVFNSGMIEEGKR